MTNDLRKQLDVQLKELVLLAQRHPHTTRERRIALTQLVDTIWQSGKLIRPFSSQFQLLYEDIYEEAVQNLFLYICQNDNINKYDVERGEVMTWVNMLLTKRFFPEAIPKIAGKGNEINLENSQIANIPFIENTSIFDQIRQCIEEDPDGSFIKEHVRDHPEANFQAIARRRCYGDSWQDISAELGIGFTTLHKFYQRCVKKFAPKLREYL